MNDFLSFNSMNFFSLAVLLIIYWHVSHYFENNNLKYKKVWQSTLLLAILTSVLDVSCWYIDGKAGLLFTILAYVLNVALFTVIGMFTAKLSLFIDYSAEFNNQQYKEYKKAFNIVTLINLVLCSLSIPFKYIFSVDSSNIYSRGDFYFVMVMLVLLPLITVLIRIAFKYRKKFNQVLTNNKLITLLIVVNIICAIAFLIFQGQGITPVTVLFPSITLSILIIQLTMTTNMLGTDMLTGLQNKLGVDKYFSTLPKTINHYFTVVFFDLDNFKYINDTYGHEEGDKAIKMFAHILLKETKTQDLAARIGGDEFLTTAIINDMKSISVLIQNIEQDINQNLIEEKKPYELKFSYGISFVLPNELISKEKLIEDADVKMYKQKRQNKTSIKNNTDSIK